MQSNSKLTENYDNQYYELIRYYLQPGKQSIIEEYYSTAAIPALNRIGIDNVGVFKPVYGANDLSLFVLIPHNSLESVYTDNEKLLKDNELLKNGKAFLDAGLGSFVFVSMEKSILRAFDGIKKIRIPENIGKSESVIYEMRIYQSPSLIAAKKKIHMFNEGGELDIFVKSGLQPIFFGETIAGNDIPNLLYMLAFESMGAREKNWAAFEADSEWLNLKNNSYYNDTVSCITDIILKPAACSQI